MARRYDNPSEYGGRDGLILNTPTGQPRELSVAERVRLMRSAGIADNLPNGTEGVAHPVAFYVVSASVVGTDLEPHDAKAWTTARTRHPSAKM